MQCGLLGEHLTHSFSPIIHADLGDYPYALFEVSKNKLETFLKETPFSGINVTIPYKKAVIPYCAQLSPIAKKLGSVNTIIRDKDGQLIGHNTDYFGFRSMVDKSGLQVAEKKVLVLGSGGASVAVCAVLEELRANVVTISRSGPNNYQNLHLQKDAAVIVNATPVGMFPNVGCTPIDLSFFPQLEGVLDLIYNPARTQLLLEAEEKGLVTENGLWMLVAQAKESAEWFTGNSLPDDLITSIYSKLRNATENLILVGMPGSGKTTIGQLLAQKTGKKFIDVDRFIEEKHAISIPEIFRLYGEVAFREMESEAIAELGQQSGLVLATGGGCVTVESNYRPLHQNGIIIWLQRDLEKLPTEGRPLSHRGTLEAMYQIRKPLYERFADIQIDNNQDANSTVAQILQTTKDGVLI